MDTYVKLVRAISWVAVSTILSMATMGAVMQRPDYCPLNFNPADCVSTFSK